jgi:CheY-like chemotaxis protein
MLKTILLVEDDARDLELIIAALARSGLNDHVVVAGDGEAALDYIHLHGASPGNPAVVLLDLKLPKVSGLEVLAEIRVSPIWRALPVVILTSSALESDRLASYSLKVNAYVVKPLEFGKLVEAVIGLGAFWELLKDAPAAHDGLGHRN